MKILTKVLLVLSVFVSLSVNAHPGGHGEMRLEIGDTQALDIVRSMTKAMTFKDRGYSVGKLDSSWAKVAKKEFVLTEESSSAFVYKVTNSENKQTLIININKNGRVQSVKDVSIKHHGHKH